MHKVKFFAKNNWVYILCAFILLFPLILFASTAFKPGYIIYRDVTEPLTLENLYQRYIYTYSNDLGETLAESARIPIFFFILLIQNVLFFLEDEAYVKIKFLLLLIATITAFFYSTKSIISTLVENENLPENIKRALENKKLVIFAVTAGTLFYLTNFWASNRLLHFHLFFTTVTFPVTVALLYKYFFSKKQSIKYLLYLVLFSAIFTPTPHTVLFQIFAFALFIFGYLVFSRQQVKEKIKRTGAVIIIFPPLYLLVNAYWILPYAYSVAVPDAVLSETIVELLGRYLGIENSVRLMGYWLTPYTRYFTNPGNETLDLLQNLIYFFPVVVFGISSYVLRRTALTKILFVSFVIGLFLSTRSPITNYFYYYLMFDSPISFIGWIFREFEKFGLVPAYVYSISTVFFILWLSTLKNKIVVVSLASLLTILMALHLNFFENTITRKFTPNIVPQEFSQVTDLIEADTEEFNTLWYPGVPEPVWAHTEEVRYVFSNLISPKPTITNRSDMIYFADFILSEDNVEKISLAKALDIVGVKYLVIRTDDPTFESEDLLESIEKKDGLTKVHSGTNLNVYRNDEFTSLVKIYKNRLVTNKGLDVLKKLDEINFNTKQTFIDFTDNPTNLEEIPFYYYFGLNNAYLDLAINQYSDRFVYPYDYVRIVENGNADAWRKASLYNLNHAESSFFFKNLGLHISQLDYGKGIVNARDGWKLVDQQKLGKPISITFQNHQNISFLDGTLNYDSEEEDFIYFWNIQESDKFDVSNIRALKVDLISNIDTKLTPHFKIMSYDENDELLEVRFIYPDEENNVSEVVKLPSNAISATFSIWTESTPGEPYSYSLENLLISNISDNVEPLALSFNIDTSECTSECVILARVLESDEGGELKITARDSSFTINTLQTFPQADEPKPVEKYNWVYVGELDTISYPITITLENIEGYNSVNALVILTKEEYQLLKQNNTEFEDQQGTSTNYTNEAGASNVIVSQQNPTLYALLHQNSNIDPNSEYVISFAKPFNNNWELKTPSEKDNIRLNGFINGWSVSGTDLQNNLSIEFTPQRYLEIGGVISGITFTVLLFFTLGLTYIEKKKN